MLSRPSSKGDADKRQYHARYVACSVIDIFDMKERQHYTSYVGVVSTYADKFLNLDEDDWYCIAVV